MDKDAATTLAGRGRILWRRLLEGLDQAAEVVADGGHVRVVRAKGYLADPKRPLQLCPDAFQVPKVLQHRPRLPRPAATAGWSASASLSGCWPWPPRLVQLAPRRKGQALPARL
jgi:hypothetical protein